MAEIVGGGTPDSSNANYWDGNIDWYTPSEIGASRTVETSVRKITHEGLDHSSARLLPAGSILFTSRASIGLMAFISRPSATNQGFQSLIPNASIDPDFLYALGPYISRYARKHAAGSTFVEISGSSLAKTPMRIPSLPEQRRIGEFFSTLDSLIAAAERQEDLLKRKKHAYLQLMFPQEGETEPRLRFAGFNGEWQQRQLGEVAEFSKGQGFSKADLCSSGIPAFLYGQMYTDYKLLVTESGQYLPQNSDGVFSTAGDVIIPASGESPEEIAIASVIGRAGILLGGDLNIIKPEKSILDSIFLALSASGGRLHDSLVSRAQGKTIVHLHNSDIATSQIRFPTLPEQRRIGEFFSTLDNLIATAEQHSESLRALKSAYLQRMFV